MLRERIGPHAARDRDQRSRPLCLNAPTGADSYRLVGPGVRNLVEGIGAVLVEEIAETLDALVEPG
jgi:hypothetical protein